jgi:hypothetical protein
MFQGGSGGFGVTCSLKIKCYSQIKMAIAPVVTLFLDDKVNCYKNLTMCLGLMGYGHAIAEAVSHWLPTMAARVQTRV